MSVTVILKRFWHAPFSVKLFALSLAWLMAFALMATAEILGSVSEHLAGVPEPHVVQPKSDLELLSAAIGTVAPLLALLGGYIAYRQLLGAERTRLAQVYIEINKRWNSDAVQKSMRLVAKVRRDYATDAAGFPTFATYLNTLLAQEEERQLEGQSSDYDAMLEIMNFLEDVGLLCRKGYVNTEDVYDFIGSSILHFVESFMPHIEGMRRGGSRTVFANALWLYANRTTRFTIDGYGA